MERNKLNEGRKLVVSVEKVVNEGTKFKYIQNFNTTIAKGIRKVINI